MSKAPYTKVPLTYAAQLQQLKDRGLIIDDEPKALHLLENISYYRLSGYWYPLLSDTKSHLFKAGATFDEAFKLYCFDKELRKLVLSELEKIEVAVRAKMIYVLSHAHGPFWYQDASLFNDPLTHASSLVKIGGDFKRSDEEFIVEFKKKYTSPLPPSWMIMEITSFGSLSVLYKHLKPGKEKREIANYFGLSDSVFESWLHSIVYIRNVCAHHSRLWNRDLRIQPTFPRKPSNAWLSGSWGRGNRVYAILCIIQYLLQTVNPNTSFKNKINVLLGAYPNVDITAMGFAKLWQKEVLWQ